MRQKYDRSGPKDMRFTYVMPTEDLTKETGRFMELCVAEVEKQFVKGELSRCDGKCMFATCEGASILMAI